MKLTEDKLKCMFDQQKEIMSLLKDKGKILQWPIDLSKKSDQMFCDGIFHEAHKELFEASRLLKNAKHHRSTEISDFDRDEFVEEVSDVLHYIIEILVMCDISVDEFFDMHTKKTEIVKKRITDGY